MERFTRCRVSEEELAYNGVNADKPEQDVIKAVFESDNADLSNLLLESIFEQANVPDRLLDAIKGRNPILAGSVLIEAFEAYCEHNEGYWDKQ